MYVNNNQQSSCGEITTVKELSSFTFQTNYYIVLSSKLSSHHYLLGLFVTPTMTEQITFKIKEALENKFERGGYKLDNAHFENGQNLHSEQYYFAKGYFQNSNNCKDLSQLLVPKLESLNFPESTTLVGFRNYVGLLLKETTNSIRNYNYAIIEEEDNTFVWQHLPELKDNLVIILPITCTCSTYIKLRKFLIDHLIKTGRDGQIRVNDDFINVFLILEESLQAQENEVIEISSLKNSKGELFKIYSAFNWTEINKEQIRFNNKTSTTFIANPLIRLYSKMYLPEACPLCFPLKGSSIAEQPLFPTLDNFETPNLIFGFPNFSNIPSLNFLETLGFDDNEGNSHLYGHIRVNKGSYVNYIRGNTFYEKNKNEILSFFDKELSKILAGDGESNIIFITAENKHNSNFLEDISLSPFLKNRSVTILRFQPTNEFVDNFISLHGKDLNSEHVKVIYFEEVVSAGTTFKLISNYLKHSKNQSPKKTGRHGFDLVLTLVDRTPVYTRDEIIKKLFSEINSDYPEDKFIAFFRLNVPIISASHLGNPLNLRIGDLEKMINQCHLDSLKIRIANEITERQPRKLPEMDSSNVQTKILSYFPFQNIEREIDPEILRIYRPSRNKERLDLLKLYLTHEINTELAKEKYRDPHYFERYEGSLDLFVKDLIDSLKTNMGDNIADHFIAPEDRESPSRKPQIEGEIVHDTIVKILSRPPFTYYKTLYEATFRYCLIKLNTLYTKIEQERINEFKVFRELKFYVKRLVDLHSNFIVSERFIGCIRDQYNKESIGSVVEFYSDTMRSLDGKRDRGEIDLEYYRAAAQNVAYKLQQVTSYFSYLLYYYKELTFKNPAISIKLEELVNSDALLPKEILKQNYHRPDNLENLISNPYFHFTGMIKAENIRLLAELKELHKRNLAAPGFQSRKNYREYYFTTHRKHDPIIINAQKLIEKSRHRADERNYKNIIQASVNMLETITVLENKKNKQIDARKPDKVNLDTELKEILDSVIQIIQPGIEEGKLKYAFFVEFKKRVKSKPDTGNIYSLVSDEPSDYLSATKLDPDGLVYNMLYGLYDDLESKNEQTLIAGVKLKNGRCISFKDRHYYKALGDDHFKESSFSDLYKKDFFDDSTAYGYGIKQLNDANMSVLFRFASLVQPHDTVMLKHGDPTQPYKLNGRAILLITSTDDCDTKGFLEFMSNEKIRLILLIKDELLAYLQKQFDNDAFVEVLENKKAAFYQNNLRHGLARYVDSLKHIVEDIESDRNNDRYFSLFQRMINATKGQLRAIEAGDYKGNDTEYSKKELLKYMRDIFESHSVVGYSIPFVTIKTGAFNLDKINLNEIILDVIFTEIIINMKRYSPRDERAELTISFEQTTRTFHFRNRTIASPYIQNTEKKGGGLSMCRKIMEKLALGIITKETKGGFCTVKIQLNKPQSI
jgi:hypothetical protein